MSRKSARFNSICGLYIQFIHISYVQLSRLWKINWILWKRGIFKCYHHVPYGLSAYTEWSNKVQNDGPLTPGEGERQQFIQGLHVFQHLNTNMWHQPQTSHDVTQHIFIYLFDWIKADLVATHGHHTFYHPDSETQPACSNSHRTSKIPLKHRVKRKLQWPRTSDVSEDQCVGLEPANICQCMLTVVKACQHLL